MQYIKIPSNILQQQWITNKKNALVLLYILAHRNFTDHVSYDVTIHAGQTLMTYRDAANDLSMGHDSIREAIEDMVENGVITVQKVGRLGTLITINAIEESTDSSTEPSTHPSTQSEESVDSSTHPSTQSTENGEISTHPSTLNYILYNNNSSNNAREAREEIFEAMLKDERWMRETSEYVRLPQETIRDEIRKFELNLNCTNNETNDETSLKKMTIGWLHTAKRRIDTENFKQLNNGFRTNNPCGTPSADVSKTGGAVGGTATTNYPVGGGTNSYPVVGGTDNSTGNTATILGGLPASNPYFRFLAEYRRKKGL